MSLSPLTHECEEFEMLDEVGISKLERLYRVNKDIVPASDKYTFKRAIQKFADGGRVTNVACGMFVDVVENITILSISGVFKCTPSQIIGNTWDFCIINIVLRDGRSYRKGFRPEQTIRLDGIDIYRISVSKLVKIHSPTRHMSQTPDILLEAPAHHDLIGYFPQKYKRGIVNVAYVHDKKWVCVGCRKAFDNQAEWSSHTKPIPDPPMPGDGWRRIKMHNRNPIMSPTIYLPRKCRPLKYFYERSLADKDCYGSVRSLWNAMMCSLSRNDVEMYHCWSRLQPSEENFRRLITDCVRKSREAWGLNGKRRR